MWEYTARLFLRSAEQSTDRESCIRESPFWDIFEIQLGEALPWESCPNWSLPALEQEAGQDYLLRPQPLDFPEVLLYLKK